jgi:3'(2'), 5'-bisphosphate nucleotidase
LSKFGKEISLAVDLVKTASKITEFFRGEGIERYKKRDQSPVTMADYASQIYILSNLKEIFSEDQVIAEENETGLIDDKSRSKIMNCFKELNMDKIKDFEALLNYRGTISERKWIVDPIDGTQGFMKGLKYAIGIGLIEDNIPKFSVICVPDYNKEGLAVFVAEKGFGAKASYGSGNFNSIHVSSQKNLQDAKLCQSLHYDLPWVSQFADLVGIQNRLQIDSMAKFCLVADGSYDLYIKPIMGYQAYSWDYGQGDLLVREAGGKVTDLDEEILRYKNEKCLLRAPGIITSNGILHDEVSSIIRDNFFSI